MISSHVQTQPSLRYALTLASLLDHSDPYQTLSIIDLANLAGVDTWWLSNQQPLRGSLTAIAKQARHEYYVSNDHHGIANTLDEALLPKLSQALAEKTPRKLIVLHLMGSHLQYQNRYSPAFQVFTDKPPKGYHSELTSQQVNSINHYDNSILYTDHLLGEIVKSLPNDQSVGLVFFSDHGEEVYDTKDFKGHGPESVTARMFEIPAMIWLNAQAQADHPDWVARFQQAENAPTMLDHIDQLISELLGLTYNQRQPQNTLGHPQWQVHPRMVYGKDYDQHIRLKE
jgi:heptose-I-phosphate ethanolaminephosphotransferase